jgi:hypothetical protein
MRRRVAEESEADIMAYVVSPGGVVEEALESGCCTSSTPCPSLRRQRWDEFIKMAKPAA